MIMSSDGFFIGNAFVSKTIHEIVERLRQNWDSRMSGAPATKDGFFTPS
jgi:hypothetical protein